MSLLPALRRFALGVRAVSDRIRQALTRWLLVVSYFVVVSVLWLLRGSPRKPSGRRSRTDRGLATRRRLERFF
jgi:hypothetical protein